MANTVETKFYDEVIKLLDDNKSTNNIIFTRERYNETIHIVKEAQSVTKKTQLQWYLTKRYDALEIAGIEKLVRRGTDVIYYCTTEEDLNALTTTETPTNRNDTNQTTPEADTDIETETNTEPETETNTEPETETNTEPETGTNTATDELTILYVPDNTEISVRKAVQLLSLYGGQGHIHCSCRSGCTTGKCKCKRKNILCNSRCHASLSCANKWISRDIQCLYEICVSWQ